MRAMKYLVPLVLLISLLIRAAPAQAASNRVETGTLAVCSYAVTGQRSFYREGGWHRFITGSRSGYIRLPQGKELFWTDSANDYYLNTGTGEISHQGNYWMKLYPGVVANQYGWYEGGWMETSVLKDWQTDGPNGYFVLKGQGELEGEMIHSITSFKHAGDATFPICPQGTTADYVQDVTMTFIARP